MIVEIEVERTGMPDLFTLTGIGRAVTQAIGTTGRAFTRMRQVVTMECPGQLDTAKVDQAFTQAGWVPITIRILPTEEGEARLRQFAALRGARPKPIDDFD